MLRLLLLSATLLGNCGGFYFTASPASASLSFSRHLIHHARFRAPKSTGRFDAGGIATVQMTKAQPNKSGSFASSSILSALCPLLKLFANTDPTAPRNSAIEGASVGLSTFSRLPWGRVVSPIAAARSSPPETPLILYEFEACPFCRRVRDALIYLDLPVEVRPCPKGSAKYRALVLASGGKEVFPYLEDNNTGTRLYESGDIVKYLVSTYGNGAEAPPLLLESTLISGWVPTLLRAGRGMTRFDGAKEPSALALELFSLENDGGCRLVREALCELELPYTLVNCGEGSIAGRAKLEAAGGGSLPFLRDSTAGMDLTGHKDIMSHLFTAYVAAPSPPLTLTDSLQEIQGN